MTLSRAFPRLLLAVLASLAVAVTHAAPSKTFKAFKIGKYQAIALSDGTLAFANDGKTVGVGHTPEEVAALLLAAGQPTTKVSFSLQPLLVKAPGKVLLFDTGAGTNMGNGAGKLGASLHEAGVDPASVTDIFISHAHGDHVGGLVDASGALAFKNATIHLSAPEWNFLKALDAKTAEAKTGIGNYDALLAAIKPKIDAFMPGTELIQGVVTAVDIKGHTPGHAGYLIASGKSSLLYIGDSAHHSVISVQKPDWTIAFDGDAPTAQASRKALIEKNAASGQRIYAVHFPFPGIGKFAKQGDHYVWVPEK